MYRRELPALTKRVSKAKADTAEAMFREVTRTIIIPWVEMEKMKPITTSPHLER